MNMITYLIERVAIIFALNVALLVPDYIALIIVLGFAVALVFAIKIYYMVAFKDKEQIG